LRAAGGRALAVSEEEIQEAQAELAQSGLYVEPTAALGPAGLRRLLVAGFFREGETVVVPLTGSGLKTA
jgi:threonine synthase